MRVFKFTEEGDLVSQVVVPELDRTYGRLRSAVLGPDGALYITTTNGGGKDKILKVVPANTPATGAPTIGGTAQVGRDAHGGHLGHHRRRRADQRFLQLSVDCKRREHRHGHRGSDQLHLHPV